MKKGDLSEFDVLRLDNADLRAQLETVVQENADLLLKLAWWQTKDQREKEAASEYVPQGLMETRLD